MKFRMQKIMSLIIAFVLLIGSGACLQSFAAKRDFDSVIRENYSPMIQDLLNGEDVEFLYYGKPMTYDLATIDAVIDAQQNLGNNGGLDSINFEATRDNSAPTHQTICATALAILLHDKGTSKVDEDYYFYDSKNSITCNTYADFMVYHAGSPDEDETGTYAGIDSETGKPTYDDGVLSIKNPFNGMTYSFVMFSGHFYNPYTEKNWKDSSTDTCKMNARRHFDAAVYFYNQGKYAEAFEQLGRGSHYVQDACQTQHSNNLTAADDADGLDGYYKGFVGNNRHGIFEKDVHTFYNYKHPFRDKLNKTQQVFDSSVYNEALKLSIENIVRNNSYSSYVLLDKSDYRYVDRGGNYDDRFTNFSSSTAIDYCDAAIAQFKNATMANVQYIWNFANEVGMTFS